MQNRVNGWQTCSSATGQLIDQQADRKYNKHYAPALLAGSDHYNYAWLPEHEGANLPRDCTLGLELGAVEEI